ncbi:MAG: succinate dehydrogenase, cytochrome b556 subunit [Mariprofundus sp.]
MSENPAHRQRPLSPRLSIYRWQFPMIASLAHRASGMVLILFVPLYLWLLHGMIGSPEQYDATLNWLHSLTGKLLLWLVGVALVYHFSNGIRFLFVDVGWADGRKVLRIGAVAVIAIAALTTVLFGLLLL